MGILSYDEGVSSCCVVSEQLRRWGVFLKVDFLGYPDPFIGVSVSPSGRRRVALGKMNLRGMKRAFVGQAQCLETPQPPIVFAAEASATCEPEPPVNKTKVLVSKEALPVVAPRKAIPPEAPRGEGSNKWRDKVVSQAQSKDEPFLT
ncbi:hypothetical protein B296_00052353 [Ensete ventricosum]|uniref:Uncharacterized protein n=1 Tax=Ensete ventricosum TaxID=4639 RepID=A0A426YCQ2_ENSVE|nr:hypothetical protein B296_00052353 [Ensete ventricosum]